MHTISRGRRSSESKFRTSGNCRSALPRWHTRSGSANLRFNPADPHWFNRDRFILSAGHGSMLLYALLHLYGYDLSLDDLKRSASLAARRPGIRNTIIRRGWKRRRARSARVWATQSASRWPKRISPLSTIRTRRSSIITRTSWPVTGEPHGGRVGRSRLAGRPLSSRQTHRPVR